MVLLLLIVASVLLAAPVHGNVHPAFPITTCSKSGCTAKNTSLVLDGKEFSVSSEDEYPANGVNAKGNVLKLTLKDGKGPRVYIVSPNDDKYELFKMPGKELSFEMEISQLDCNMNGALYFVQMPETGARNGTGYCDANGVGGAHCEEMDIWEANKYATVMTNHPTAYDSSGCGTNPYKKGKKTLYGYGSGFTVDTSKVFTVVTQFFTDSSGRVSEIRRLYHQKDQTTLGGSLKDSCKSAQMGDAMRGGSVLAISVWYSTGMTWLDAGDAGPCPTGTTSRDAVVTFSDIRIGDIGTTASWTNWTPPSTAPPAPIPLWGQCGGLDYEGGTQCAEGTCTKLNDWTWQCRK